MVFLIKCYICTPIINIRIPVTPFPALTALGVVRILHCIILMSKHLLFNKDQGHFWRITSRMKRGTLQLRAGSRRCPAHTPGLAHF